MIIDTEIQIFQMYCSQFESLDSWYPELTPTYAVESLFVAKEADINDLGSFFLLLLIGLLRMCFLESASF